MINLFNHELKIISTDLVYEFGRYRVFWARMEYKGFDGKRATYSWLIFDRGNAVAVLVHRKSDGKFCIVEQLRPATLVKNGKIVIAGGGFLEIVAGTLNPGENPVACIKRETPEEIGRNVKNIRLVANCYMSPGSSTEKIAVYLAEDAGKADLPGGGLEEESEDIRIHWLELEEIAGMIKSGEIEDAKTILAVQAYMLENK